VFVDTEGHDIILAGPADALTVDATGNVVAATSGRPLLQLEDLVVALRAIDAARAGGMKCSIDPTAEGVARLQALLRTQKTIGPNPDATLVAMQNAMGPQQVTVGGVPGAATLPIGFSGFRFALGLGIAITGGVADADTTAVAAGQVKVMLSRTV
jgi:hypothetical protein